MEKYCCVYDRLVNGDSMLIPELISEINSENVSYISGVVYRFTTDYPVASYDPSFISALNKLFATLKSYSPSSVHYMFKEILPREQEKTTEKEFSIIDRIAKLICITFINTRKSQIKYHVLKYINNEESIREINDIDIIERFSERTTNQYFFFSIAIILNENNIQGFLNLILQIHFYMENFSESEEKIAFPILDNLYLIFFYLEKHNPDVYEKMLSFIYTEKRYFKEIIVCNIDNLDISQILKFIRPYNFEVFACLFVDKPEILREFIIQFYAGNILIQKKVFIKFIIKYDKYFINFFDLLRLESFEISDIINQSEIFKSKLSLEEQL